MPDSLAWWLIIRRRASRPLVGLGDQILPTAVPTFSAADARRCLPKCSRIVTTLGGDRS